MPEPTRIEFERLEARQLRLEHLNDVLIGEVRRLQGLVGETPRAIVTPEAHVPEAAAA